ncbi:MAG: hypothetical protein IKF22_03505 [Lachnospiraceae bacterium]|nr:hypothetical protein [Lachnospiraceae bacterium]
MNAEQKKEWLSRYRQARYAEQEIALEIEQLEGQFIMPARPLDGMPHGSGGTDLSGFAAAYDKLRSQLMRQYDRRLEIYREIVDVIERSTGLNETERSVLRYRYILCMSWEDIVEQIHMERSWILRIRNNAVDKLSIKKRQKTT